MSLELTTQSAGKPIQVEVDLEDQVLTDEQLVQTLRENGCAKMTSTYVRDMSRIGVRLKGIGVTKLQRGIVMVDQAKIDEAIDIVRQLISERMGGKERGRILDMTRLTASLSTLLKQKVDAQRLALMIEQVASPSKPEEPDEPVKDFVPGRAIQPRAQTNNIVAATVHVHPAAPAGRSEQ